jgi:hypothetical protein
MVETLKIILQDFACPSTVSSKKEDNIFRDAAGFTPRES